jgi:hypothetical protein
MDKYKFLNKLFRKHTICLLVIFSLFLGISSLPAKAEVFLRPTDDNLSNFFFNLKPGESVNSKFSVSNPNSTSTDLELSSKDSILTSDNNLTLKENSQKDEAVGSWISLPTKDLSVQPGGNLTLDFSLKVPENTTSGEYIGGITAVEKLPENSQNTISRIRKTIRMYVFVAGSEPNLVAQAKDLTILSTKLDNYLDLRKEYLAFGKRNLTFQIPAINLGNIYTNFTINYKIITPDGLQKEGSSNFTLVPEKKDHILTIFTGQEYQVGQTLVSVDYQITPYDSNFGSKVATINGDLKQTLDLDQTDLDKFLPPAVSNKITNTPNNFSYSQAASTKTTNSINSSVNIGVLSTILGLFAIIVYLGLHKKINFHKKHGKLRKRS